MQHSVRAKEYHPTRTRRDRPPTALWRSVRTWIKGARIVHHQPASVRGEPVIVDIDDRRQLARIASTAVVVAGEVRETLRMVSRA